MKAEAMPFVDEMGLKKWEPSPIPSPLPAEVYTGRLENGAEVMVVHNGTSTEHGVDHIGGTATTLSAYALCQHLGPDVVVSAGTAGGFKGRGGEIGDTYLTSEFKFHDSRIQLPGFDRYGVGAREALNTPRLQEHLGAKRGVTSSGSSLDCSDKDAEMLAQNAACAKDMEGASIAFVCALFGTPLVGIKTITDIVDGDRPSGALLPMIPAS